MRVLQVVHGYPPAEAGGAELLTNWLSAWLAGAGHRVAVVARSADGARRDGEVSYEEAEGVEVARIVSNCLGLPFREHYSSTQFDSELEAHIRCFDPDVVHVQHTAGLTGRVIEIAVEQGYPVTLALHDAYYLCARVHLVDASGENCPGPDGGRRCVPCLEHWPGADPAHRFGYFRRLLSYPQMILAPSEWLAEAYRRGFPEIASKLVVEPPGIPLFEPVAAERPKRPLRLVAFGSLIPEKGFHLIAEALRSLAPGSATCRVFGVEVERAAQYAGELRSLAGDDFAVMPPVAHGEIPKVLGEADAVVIPSVCGESFSFVAREAFRAGVPIIAARSGALVEALADGRYGLLFAAGNPCALADAIRELEDPERFRRAAQSAGPVRGIGEYAEALLESWQRLIRPRSAFFSYAEYEGRLRREEQMRERLRPYVRFFKGCGRVADLAAGGGIFLEMLKEEGVSGVGVDRSPDAVRRMRERGLEAIEADAVDYVTQLRDCDGVFVSHLLEHLTFVQLERLIAGIASILPPSGIAAFILPNPESIRMHLFGFWRDPEHVRFYHPDLVDAVCAHYRLARIFSSGDEKPFHVGAPLIDIPEAGNRGGEITESLRDSGAYVRDEPPSFLGPPADGGDSEAPASLRSRSFARRAASRAFSELCSALRLVQASSLNRLSSEVDRRLALLCYELDRSAREGEERDFTLFQATSRAVGKTLDFMRERDQQLSMAVKAFNEHMALLAEALNRMWCWIDDTGLVYQKAGRLRLRAH